MTTTPIHDALAAEWRNLTVCRRCKRMRPLNAWCVCATDEEIAYAGIVERMIIHNLVGREEMALHLRVQAQGQDGYLQRTLDWLEEWGG